MHAYIDIWADVEFSSLRIGKKIKIAAKKSLKLELLDDTSIHYKTMISNNLLVHLYPT